MFSQKRANCVNGAINCFCFRLETPFLGKFGEKNQNYLFKLKFGTQTNSNIQNSIVVFNCSVLDRKHTFRENLVKKIKIVILSRNLVPRLIRIFRIQWWCSLFLFQNRNTIFGQFGPKNQNCQYNLKFGTQTNSNMKNSMMVFTFSVLYWKHPFW